MGAISSLFAQNQRISLSGHIRPGVIIANDQGRVASSLNLRHLTLILPPSVAQQADLTALLVRQQDPASPDFHRWLTPEEYGARFGPPAPDLARVTAWLASQNLTVDSIGRGRTTVAFSGNVRDVELAFQTEIHNYRVDGELHYANAGEPSVPAALAGVVRWIRGLDDFRMKPVALKRPPGSGAAPDYTSASGYNFLAPQDIATLYDIAPLYNSGITGKGQKIVVVGQTQVDLTDIERFRTYFNLTVNDPQIVLVPASIDPGINADLIEADLDIEWAGAIAPDASVVYVYSLFVFDALDYAIDQNLAPVITMSYGQCELVAGAVGTSSERFYAERAASQGISFMAASADTGANGCYGQSPSRNITGLSVDLPASIPEVTAVGGTTLNEGGGTYWNFPNDGNHASAVSYIPETTWNDSLLYGSPTASTGGASSYFGKPSWQTGPGVPDDGQRDVPDIAMPASAVHDPYLIYSAGLLQPIGGTSVSSPVFAGIAALLNQYMVANGFQATAGQGNMNPRLYVLAQASPGAFHDITTGDNMVASCSPKQTNCVATQVGYAAGPGYDRTTGLGSVDAWNLISGWPQNNTAANSAVTVQLTSSLTSLLSTDTTMLTATVTAGDKPRPTGTVTFYLAGAALGSAKLTGSGLTATASLAVTAAQLTVGPAESMFGMPRVTPDVTAVYSGDSVYASGAASLTISVASPSALAITGTSSAASFGHTYAPGMIMAMFGQNLAGSTPDPQGSPLPTALANTTSTVNGIPAPLYYVSPGQINLQIPYEIPASSTAIIKVTANGQTATSQILVQATAPGIFADSFGMLVPYQATGRGQTIVLFETGDGMVSPKPVTGSVPASGTLPVPNAEVIVTVGGIAAPTPYAFIGVPSWSIGATQINFTIPANAPLGFQPVVVTAGGVRSFPAYIEVTP